jgi:hypothetical protein
MAYTNDRYCFHDLYLFTVSKNFSDKIITSCAHFMHFCIYTNLTLNRGIVGNHEGHGLFSWVEPLILVFPKMRDPRAVECDTRSITYIYIYIYIFLFYY